MPPFIPPENPPALIQSVTPEDVNDRTNFSKLLKKIVREKRDRHQKISFELARKINSVLLAPPPLTSSERSQPQQATSEVVEFYNAEPKKINLPPLPTPDAIESTAKNAQSLGTPLSVGGEVIKELKPTLQSAQAIKGLSQIRLTQEHQTTKLLVTKQRGGTVREFQMSPTLSQDAIAQQENPTAPPKATPEQQRVSVVEVIADRQEYDSQRQVITATGNVEIRFPNGVLVADRVQVNVSDRVAVAQGEVVLTRGEQILRGNRFEYYFVQDSGVILQANGEIYQPSVGRDFSPTLPTDTGTDAIPNQTLSDRLALNQPLQRVTTTGGYSFVVGGGDGPDIVGQEDNGLSDTTIGGAGRVNRVRFQAERIDFDAEQWTATNVRLTNDPFSPPELELRADRATYRNIAPLVDEVTLSDSRIVFDQSFSVPTFQDRIIIDRRPRQPGLFSIAYDGRDRGGLYIERGFNIIDTQNINLQIKPQFLIQRAFLPDSVDSDNVEDGGIFDPSSFGLIADLDVNLGVRTDFQARTSFSSLDVGDVADNLRANVQFRQKIGALSRPHDLRLEYNYRERLFNGSLGFQTVQSSVGAILVSPTIALGNTGINLSYQASVQQIEARTDRPELLEPEREDNLIDLTRYQSAASISKGFMIWQGEALPPTAKEGLRYTPTPVQPFLQLSAGLTGVASFYSNGDSQPSLIGSVGLLGQFGNFSRPFFDYTGFNISYSQGIRGDESPFLFDRFADTQTLSFGITQQIYGPIRIGVQSSLSLNTNEEISTDYFIEYSRRTYNILLRYNPVLQVGSINLRISDFNWSGNPGSLEGTDIRPVIRGVTR